MTVNQRKKSMQYTIAGGTEVQSSSENYGFRVEIAGLDATLEEKRSFTYAVEEAFSALRLRVAARQPETIAAANATVVQLRRLFLHPVYVEQIPNEYWPKTDPYALTSPWLIVTTQIGRIKLGWRKRVLEIDWIASENEIPAEVLFPAEDVTKVDRTIHAHSYGDAIRYLKVIIG
jgi:hypothetical protein